MTDVLTYNPALIRLALAGFALARGGGKSGYAEDTFLKVTSDGPSFIVVKGADGTVNRIATNERGLKIEFSTMQTNQLTNAFLSALLTSDENSPNGAGIGTFVMQDLQGTTKLGCSACWIEGFPDQEWGKSAKARNWALYAVRDAMIVGGN